MENTRKYCDIEDNCKLLKQMQSQYDAVVNQNRSLQTELNQLRKIKNDVLKDPLNLREVLLMNCVEDDVISRYENDIRKKIVGFLTEMSSQDNRGTIFPYYYTIIDYNNNYVPDDRGEFFYDPYAAGIEKIEDCIHERYEDELIELSEGDNLDDILKYIGTSLEDDRINEWLEEHINETLQRFSTEPVSWSDGVFLTEKDAEAYLESARNHHSEQAHIYVDCMCKWGRNSLTEEFLANLFAYFGVKIPPEMYYENKKKAEATKERIHENK